MKRIILAAVLIFILLQLQVNAGVLCQAQSPGYETLDYNIRAISTDCDNVWLLQITLASDCCVLVRVIDQDTIVLADGDMSAGSYNVYFKAKEGMTDAPVSCSMEIYLNQRRSELLLRRDIKFQAD